MQKRRFVKNAAILTITSLLLRTIGIFFRIYVSNRVGAEGMGLYQLIVSVYVLASSFATSGLTTAVTRLCTDELACGRVRTAKRVLYSGITLSVTVGMLSAVAIYCGSDIIANTFLHDARAASSLRILTVSLPFMGASSCIKGYFVARRHVGSSSFAQILEQLVRIGVIVFILDYFRISTVEGSCFAVMLGDTVAEATSCFFMVTSYMCDRVRLQEHGDTSSKSTKLTRRLVGIAAPITGGRYLSSGLRTFENVSVPSALEAYGSTRERALEQFGKLKGMALPLIFFPSSFLTAVTTLLIPEISEAKVLGQTRRLIETIEKALQITLLSSILIAAVFMKISYPLGELLYHDREIGWILFWLAPLAPVMYLESVVVGLLKGLNQQTHSLWYSVLDSACRIGLIVWWIPIKGMVGFLWVMVFSNLLTCTLNTARLCRVSMVHIALGKWILKPICCAVIAVGISAVWQGFIDQPIAFCILCSVTMVAVYFPLLFVFGCIEKSDCTRYISFHRKKT